MYYLTYKSGYNNTFSSSGDNMLDSATETKLLEFAKNLDLEFNSEDFRKFTNYTHRSGVEEGIRAYAHWKDGIQYVGTTGMTLKEALADKDYP